MLKTYYYTEADCGFDMGPGGLRFDGMEDRVDSPERADIIIVPPTIRHMRFRNNTPPLLLRYIEQCPEKHVLFDICDSHDCFPDLERCIFIRCMVDDNMLQTNPRTMANPWPARDLYECMDYSDIRYSVSFVGWDSGPLRKVAAESCQRTFGDKALVKLNRTFFAYYSESEQKEMESRFKDSLRQSLVILASPSVFDGFVPYRFYEAMSAGRVPAVCGKKPILPFADKIPWDDCYIHIPSDDGPRAGEHIARWLETHDAFDVGMQNRLYWEMWLDSTYWPRLHRIMVEELLERERTCKSS